jgi:hypothetical protein
MAVIHLKPGLVEHSEDVPVEELAAQHETSNWITPCHSIVTLLEKAVRPQNFTLGS